MKSVWLTIASLSLVASAASATVRREGTWPEHEPKVSLDLHATPRTDAIRKLADSSGWSLIVDLPAAATATPLDIKLNDEEPGKILDVLMTDGNYVAVRDGKIVTIKADLPPTAPASSTAGSPLKDVGDVRVMGGSDRIEAGTMAQSAKVVGGSLEVYGTINGDLKVTGGSVRLRPGSHVKGSIKIVGGSVQADEGATVDHRPKVLGGAFITKGNVSAGAKRHDDDDDDGDIHIASKSGNSNFTARVSRFGDSVMDVISGASLLFLFGIVVLTLGKDRAELMRGEVVTRPMRAVAVGVVSMIAIPLVLVLLCITVIGIPFAVAGVLLLALGGFAALVCALQVLGQMLIRHKTTNPYAHLALGIAIYAVVASLPLIGSWVVLAAFLISLGVFVGTRAAGFVKKKAGLPYRTAAEL